MRFALRLAACLACLAVPALAAAAPPQPAKSMVDEEKCDWEWLSGGGIGVWAERCTLPTGAWKLEYREATRGFVLTIDGKDEVVVLQRFDKGPDQRVNGILPALRAGGYIPNDDECVFQTAAEIPNPVPGVLAFFEITPIGNRKAAFDATPADEIPEPPCPDYGWSTHGTRYFVTDTGFPDRVIYVNTGQDGLMFDPSTVTME